MNLKQLRYVLVLSNEGSFSKAAEVLNISQPSLSQYVKKIEKEIGLDLFDRVGGNVKLTDAGRVYIEAGKQILDIEHQMNSKFIDISSFKTGTLTIGTSPFRSATMMPLVAKRFQEMYPGMHLIIEEHVTSDLIDGMEHGEFDFCIMMLPVNGKVFSYEQIMEEEIVLAVPASYPKINAEPMKNRKFGAIDIREISENALVTITETQVMQKTVDNLCFEYNINVEPAAVVKSIEAQISMVRAGVGMAIVPSSVECFCTSDEVEFYSFKQELPKRKVVAMWRKDRPLSKTAKELIDEIKKIEW